VRRAALALAATLSAGAAHADADLGLRCVAEAESGNYRLCEQAAAAAPTDVRVRRAFARALLIGGAENRAVFEYDHVARLAPNDARAHFDLAAALGSLNYFEDAERPLERALALQPDFDDAHRLAVILHQRFKRWDRVLAHSQTLAGRGDSAAMFDVSLAYEFGRGAPQSDAEALAWLTKAAEAGHVGAADRLTHIHLEGLLGAPRDETTALAWAAKARQARQRLE
jgi:TPR repeat protein